MQGLSIVSYIAIDNGSVEEGNDRTGVPPHRSSMGTGQV